MHGTRLKKPNLREKKIKVISVEDEFRKVFPSALEVGGRAEKKRAIFGTERRRERLTLECAERRAVAISTGTKVVPTPCTKECGKRGRFLRTVRKSRPTDNYRLSAGLWKGRAVPKTIRKRHARPKTTVRFTAGVGRPFRCATSQKEAIRPSKSFEERENEDRPGQEGQTAIPKNWSDRKKV